MTLTVEEIKYMETVVHCLPRIVKELAELNKTLKAILELLESRVREVGQDRPPP